MKKKRALLSHFPRSSDLPSQSPKYWTKEKDRYLRQLLINDIEEETGRPLIVFFSQLDQSISATDPDDLSEILSGVPSDEIDIFLQTPGGSVDATEKIVSVLKKSLSGYRVIVPSWAKSAGTVIAISSDSIVMGVNSELGPIDPQFPVNGNLFPAELLQADDQFPQHLREFFGNAVKRTKEMAKQFLSSGMLKDRPEAVDSVISKISDTSGYLSHGAVIDYDEANELGLSVSYLPQSESLWRRIWLLYCMYDYDMKQKNLGKIFESVQYSLARPK